MVRKINLFFIFLIAFILFVNVSSAKLVSSGVTTTSLGESLWNANYSDFLALSAGSGITWTTAMNGTIIDGLMPYTDWNATNTSYLSWNNTVGIGNLDMGNYNIDNVGILSVHTIIPLSNLSLRGGLNVSNDNTTSLFVDTNTHSVGIGTDTPTQFLQVIGDKENGAFGVFKGKESGTDNWASQGISIHTSIANGFVWLMSDNLKGIAVTPPTLRLTTVYQYGYPQYNQGGISIDQFGFVGINNTNPQNVLNVRGDVNVTDGLIYGNGSQLTDLSFNEDLWNNNYSTFLTLMPYSSWNATNTSYLTYANWNATNTSYASWANVNNGTMLNYSNALNGTLVNQSYLTTWNFYNTTNFPQNASLMTYANWNATNTSYLLATNNTWLYSLQWTNNASNFTSIYGWLLGNSTWNANASNFTTMYSNIATNSSVYAYAMNDSKWSLNYSNMSIGWLYAVNSTGGASIQINTTTCGGTQKVSSINNVTGAVTCTADETSAGGGKSFENFTLLQTDIISDNNNASMWNITNLSVQLSPDSYYNVICDIMSNSSIVTTGLRARVNTSGTPTSVLTIYQSPSTATAMEWFSGTDVVNTTFLDTGNTAVTTGLGQIESYVKTGASVVNYTVEVQTEIYLSRATLKNGTTCRTIKIF